MRQIFKREETIGKTIRVILNNEMDTLMCIHFTDDTFCIIETDSFSDDAELDFSHHSYEKEIGNIGTYNIEGLFKMGLIDVDTYRKNKDILNKKHQDRQESIERVKYLELKKKFEGS